LPVTGRRERVEHAACERPITVLGHVERRDLDRGDERGSLGRASATGIWRARPRAPP